MAFYTIAGQLETLKEEISKTYKLCVSTSWKASWAVFKNKKHWKRDAANTLKIQVCYFYANKRHTWHIWKWHIWPETLFTLLPCFGLRYSTRLHALNYKLTNVFNRAKWRDSKRQETRKKSFGAKITRLDLQWMPFGAPSVLQSFEWSEVAWSFVAKLQVRAIKTLTPIQQDKYVARDDKARSKHVATLREWLHGHSTGNCSSYSQTGNTLALSANICLSAVRFNFRLSAVSPRCNVIMLGKSSDTASRLLLQFRGWPWDKSSTAIKGINSGN